MANRYTNCRNLQDSYKEYKENEKGSIISYKEYTEIIYAANKKIANHILDGGFFKMPYSLGDLQIRRHKVNYNNLKIDFAEFNKTGKKIRMLNEHTDGWYFYFKWDKSLCNVPYRFFYSFIPTRTNSRTLTRLLKSGEKKKIDFFE